MTSRPVFTSRFWLDVADRVIRTSAQTAVALITANATSWIDVDWAGVGGVVGLTALLTVLTAISTAGLGDTGTASVVKSDTSHVAAALADARAELQRLRAEVAELRGGPAIGLLGARKRPPRLAWGALLHQGWFGLLHRAGGAQLTDVAAQGGQVGLQVVDGQLNVGQLAE